jgi:uncharacterized protein
VQPVVADGTVVGSLLVKLAMRCNIACTYCYWFRDETVYDAPPLLTADVQAAFIDRLARHLERFRPEAFPLMFHGGEPLLFGKARFARLVEELLSVAAATGTRLPLSIQTNAMLVDNEWAALLHDLDVNVGVSIDGPPAVHDARRVDFRGNGTYDRTRRGIELLQQAGVPLGALAVCDPAGDAGALLAHIVHDLGVFHLDVLVPDATHEDRPLSISRFYVELFDAWVGGYADRGVNIRVIDSMLSGLLGGRSQSQSIGYGPVTTVTLLTDGSLEALDVCRVAGTAATKGTHSVLTHDIQDVARDPLWREVHHASLHLAAPCEACELKMACGGGHVASRWSEAARFDNPSVYCEDYKAIFGHVWRTVAPTLFLETPVQEVAR